MSISVEISIIIPVIDEEENIKPTFQFIQKNIPPKTSYEIIFIDDNSTDKTVDVINSLIKEYDNVSLVKSTERKGLGWAYIQGVNKSNSKYLLFLDADMSIDGKSFSKMINLRNLNNFIIGSRYLKDSKINYPSNIKVILSKYLNKLISKMYNLKISDAGHSFRIFPKIDIGKIEIYTHPGFFWRLSIYCKSLNLNALEVPVEFTDRVYGKTKNKYMSLLKSILLFFIYKFK